MGDISDMMAEGILCAECGVMLPNPSDLTIPPYSYCVHCGVHRPKGTVIATKEGIVVKGENE